MGSKIISAEKIAANEYKLITKENHAYHYIWADTDSESWLEAEPSCRNRKIEGQHILLDWIQNPAKESPAYIKWNFEGKAMLRIKLNSIYDPIPEYNIYGSEVNPFEFSSSEKWVVDTACPIKRIG